MRVNRRHITVGAVSLGLVIGAVAPAQAATTGYVALGDSYSAGTGTRSYLNDGTSCDRSQYAYPALIAAAKGLALTFRACNGANVADVQAKQLDAVNASTGFVTVSVGGNDAGFVPTMIECAKPGWMSDCNGAINKAHGIINKDLPARLDALLGQIRSRSPRASGVLVGYPRLFDGRDCNVLTFFSGAEMDRLNQTADLLDARMGEAAARAGAHFVNPIQAFMGHAVCDQPEWVNGASLPLKESYHPNRSGQTGYTSLVAPLAPVGSPVPASVARLAKAVRSYAAIDATIKPERFVLPDLDTPAAAAAARRHGINLNDPASVASWDR